MNALSTRNDDPQGASRPFSASRDGFVMAEGAACLVVEELEHAIARGAHIYAELVGTGLSADAYHLTATHPDGLGAKLVMTNALEDAGLSPEDIDYINVHGTSTPVGDISESKAIKEVFGDAAYKLNISSTKSMTGHLLGAAGAIEAVFALKAVEEDIVPPHDQPCCRRRRSRDRLQAELHLQPGSASYRPCCPVEHLRFRWAQRECHLQEVREVIRLHSHVLSRLPL